MTCDEVIVLLAERLGRYRALCEQESRWLERSLREHDRRMGVSRGKWGPGKPLWSPADDAQMLVMSDDGKTANEIAKAFDKTPQAIRSRLRHLRRREQIGMGGAKTWVR